MRRKRAFDIVYAEALDRISRDQEDAAGFFKRMLFAGVRDRNACRGRDQRTPCRPQRDDERAVPEGPRPEDAARTSGPCPPGLVWRWALLRLRPVPRMRPASAASTRAKPRSSGHLPRLCRRHQPTCHRQKAQPEGHIRALGRSVARHHHPRAHHPRDGDPQQRALHRAARLEPPNLPQGSQDGPTPVPAQSAGAWILQEVPALRIVDDELWDAVKARQAAHSGERPRGQCTGDALLGTPPLAPSPHRLGPVRSVRQPAMPRSVAIISPARLLVAAAHAPIGRASGVRHWKA